MVASVDKENEVVMNRLIILSTAVFCALTPAIHATETARVRMFCLSLQFQTATAYDYAGFQWTVDLTTLQNGVNGELAPGYLTSSYSHSASINVSGGLDDETGTGAFAVDVPGGGDANNNGFPDFWEVSQPVSGLTSSGAIQCSALSINSTLSATWNRDAGSATGYCYYTIPDFSNPFNTMTISHMFTLLEYDGTLTYTPGSNVVSGDVFLTETNSGNTLGGAVQFVKSTTNRFNVLTLQSIKWTNSLGQAFSLYRPHEFQRPADWPTNYYGYVEFVDGDLNTSGDDYYLWEMSIDDLNDADHDGIPDFSDDPAAVAPPSRPVLSLSRTSSNLLLTIEGATNHLHLIQAIDSLSSTNWQTVETLTLTNQSQVVSLPLPSADRQYWRVLAQ